MLFPYCYCVWVVFILYSVREEPHQIAGLGSFLGRFQGSIVESDTSGRTTEPRPCTVLHRGLHGIIDTPDKGHNKSNLKPNGSSDLQLPIHAHAQQHPAEIRDVSRLFINNDQRILQDFGLVSRSETKYFIKSRPEWPPIESLRRLLDSVRSPQSLESENSATWHPAWYKYQVLFVHHDQWHYDTIDYSR